MRKTTVKQPKSEGRCGFGGVSSIVDCKIAMLKDCFECIKVNCTMKKQIKRIGRLIK